MDLEQRTHEAPCCESVLGKDAREPTAAGSSQYFHQNRFSLIIEGMRGRDAVDVVLLQNQRKKIVAQLTCGCFKTSWLLPRMGRSFPVSNMTFKIASARKALDEYVVGLQDWMAGILDWHILTGRYPESALRRRYRTPPRQRFGGFREETP